MSIQGQLRDMGIAELIQYNCQEGRTARITLEHDGERAVLYIQDGQVVHAEMADLEGEGVIHSLFDWQEGSFFSEPGVLPPSRTIERSYTSLLLESAHRIDSRDGGEERQSWLGEQSWNLIESESGERPGSMDDTVWRVRQVEGVVGAVIVAEDGVVLAHDLEGDPEKEGAVAAFVAASAREIGEAMGLGMFQRASVTIGKKATPVLILATPEYSIGVILGEKTSPALVASRLESLLD